MASAEGLDLLRQGVVIPAHPLALNQHRQLDARRQRALSRYYIAAGVGGLAVGVHTTQFAIRDPRVGLFEPVLAIAAEQYYSIGILQPPMGFGIAKNNFRNILDPLPMAGPLWRPAPETVQFYIDSTP